jgi:hypothetical protein
MIRLSKNLQEDQTNIEGIAQFGLNFGRYIGLITYVHDGLIGFEHNQDVLSDIPQILHPNRFMILKNTKTEWKEIREASQTLYHKFSTANSTL